MRLRALAYWSLSARATRARPSPCRSSTRGYWAWRLIAGHSRLITCVAWLIVHSPRHVWSGSPGIPAPGRNRLSAPLSGQIGRPRYTIRCGKAGRLHLSGHGWHPPGTPTRRRCPRGPPIPTLDAPARSVYIASKSRCTRTSGGSNRPPRRNIRGRVPPHPLLLRTTAPHPRITSSSSKCRRGLGRPA